MVGVAGADEAVRERQRDHVHKHKLVPMLARSGGEKSLSTGGAPVRRTERRQGSIEAARGTTLPYRGGVRACAGAQLARVRKICMDTRGNVSAPVSRPWQRARMAVALRQTNRCKKGLARTARTRRCRQQHLQERLPSLA
jgi:hypothetical protein